MSTVVRSFPGLGRVPPSLSLSDETVADSGHLLQPEVHGAGDMCRRCCSESTLQDDVVAVIAFCCKRNTGHGYVSKEELIQCDLGGPKGHVLRQRQKSLR